jgi:acyl-CoA reductase-like NAD-dependent aldehyde dehydrogenase
MTEKVINVTSPHDGANIGSVVGDDWNSIEDKVRAASTAMESWGRTSPTERADALIAIAASTRAHMAELVQLLSSENGKTHREAEMELERYVGQFIQYAGLTTTIGGRHLSLGNGVTGWVDRRPVGVVAAIVPWNFPASLFGTKLAPALAAGCGFLVKPAESTSLITLRLAEIAKTHLPEGLLDVVIGGGAIAASLVAHPGIRRIAFTGSTEVGRMVAVAGSAVFKRCTLELGGCDPFVLLEGTDLRAAVRALGGTRFYNAGQVCVAPKRLIVERSVLDETVDLLQERLSRVVLGNSAVSPSATMGPMHTFDSRARLLDQIEDAVKHGAQQIGARVPDREDLAGGAYIEPGLLIDPSTSARVRVEETFGPVLTVIPFDFDDQAVQIANETTFGLGASVWGADIDRCMRIVGLIDSGYKWVNALGRVYDELPFGGIKESGIGREHGTEGLDSYLEDISIVVGTGA